MGLKNNKKNSLLYDIHKVCGEGIYKDILIKKMEIKNTLLLCRSYRLIYENNDDHNDELFYQYIDQMYLLKIEKVELKKMYKNYISNRKMQEYYSNRSKEECVNNVKYVCNTKNICEDVVKNICDYF